MWRLNVGFPIPSVKKFQDVRKVRHLVVLDVALGEIQDNRIDEVDNRTALLQGLGLLTQRPKLVSDWFKFPSSCPQHLRDGTRVCAFVAELATRIAEGLRIVAVDE